MWVGGRYLEFSTRRHPCSSGSVSTPSPSTSSPGAPGLVGSTHIITRFSSRTWRTSGTHGTLQIENLRHGWKGNRADGKVRWSLRKLQGRKTKRLEQNCKVDHGGRRGLHRLVTPEEQPPKGHNGAPVILLLCKSVPWVRVTSEFPMALPVAGKPCQSEPVSSLGQRRLFPESPGRG